MRLIDADVASRWMEQNEAYMDAEILRAIPTVDAVPVVRCKDCKHLFYTMCMACGFLPHKPNDFCSYGERRDGGADNG